MHARCLMEREWFPSYSNKKLLILNDKTRQTQTLRLWNVQFYVFKKCWFLSFFWKVQFYFVEKVLICSKNSVFMNRRGSVLRHKRVTHVQKDDGKDSDSDISSSNSIKSLIKKFCLIAMVTKNYVSYCIIERK